MAKKYLNMTTNEYQKWRGAHVRIWFSSPRTQFLNSLSGVVGPDEISEIEEQIASCDDLQIRELTEVSKIPSKDYPRMQDA